MKRNDYGFSLVEMAVVLIIFGLVLASASSILTLFVNKGGAERTRKMMESNKNVLFSVAASDGYLQKLAVGTKPANVTTTYPNDAYNVPFYTIVDATLGYGANLDQLDYSPICGTDGTLTSLRLCNDAACSAPATISDVAFVMVSGSTNKNIQTDVDTTVTPNLVTVYVQGDDAIDDHAADLTGAARAEKYDDIVDWVTLPELRSKAGCDPEKLRLLDTAMPVIQAKVDYDFAVFAEGGVPYRQSATNQTVREYNFTLDDDGGLPAYSAGPPVSGIGFFVVGELSDSEITETATAKGEYLIIKGNATTIGTTPYLVKITVTDNASVVGGSNNTITRTLYIKPQN